MLELAVFAEAVGIPDDLNLNCTVSGELESLGLLNLALLLKEEVK